ncbi:MAG: hypothetical protein AMS20_03235 [Gemmatimonas sp. SG8_28]|nr:MAG: hypothetical protein AMS20_03235 [Gemmatimonas sp. SG8_28]
MTPPSPRRPHPRHRDSSHTARHTPPRHGPMMAPRWDRHRAAHRRRPPATREDLAAGPAVQALTRAHRLPPASRAAYRGLGRGLPPAAGPPAAEPPPGRDALRSVRLLERPDRRRPLLRTLPARWP